MTDSFSSWKRKTLEKRKSNLYEELEAANEQLGQMLGAAVRLRIKRKIASLEEEIQEIEEELNRLTPSPAQQNGESKAPEGTQPAAPQELFGTGNRWAVLVGANQYEDWDYYRSLHVCVKDAAALHDQLILGGVNTANIHMLTDETDVPPTRGKILSLLQLAANTAERDDMLLFYYSGHGEADGGESYLVARDGHYNALRDTAVPISRVKEILQGSEARAKVIILDACHSGADFEGKGPKPMSPAFIQHVFEQAKGLANGGRAASPASFAPSSSPAPSTGPTGMPSNRGNGTPTVTS